MGGEIVSLAHWLPLPPGNVPDTHFHQGLSRPQGHGTVGRNMSLKNPVALPGIDLGTIRLLAQRLNHYFTPSLYWLIQQYNNHLKCEIYEWSCKVNKFKSQSKRLAVAALWPLSCIPWLRGFPVPPEVDCIPHYLERAVVSDNLLNGMLLIVQMLAMRSVSFVCSHIPHVILNRKYTIYRWQHFLLPQNYSLALIHDWCDSIN